MVLVIVILMMHAGKYVWDGMEHHNYEPLEIEDEDHEDT